MSDSLRVVATLSAQPDKADALKSILLGLIAPTRAEAGCISYELLQSKTNPSDFVFVEEWSSDQALDAHMTTPHFQDVVTQAGPMLAGPTDIRRFVLVA